MAERAVQKAAVLAVEKGVTRAAERAVAMAGVARAVRGAGRVWEPRVGWKAVEATVAEREVRATVVGTEDAEVWVGIGFGGRPARYS